MNTLGLSEDGLAVAYAIEESVRKSGRAIALYPDTESQYDAWVSAACEANGYLWAQDESGAGYSGSEAAGWTRIQGENWLLDILQVRDGRD